MPGRHSPAEITELQPTYRGSSRRRGMTLEEFYLEVHERSRQSCKHFFSHKDAEEIESMMRHNRTLIDSKQKQRA